MAKKLTESKREQVIQELKKGKDKKFIANFLGIEIGNVYKIAKELKLSGESTIDTEVEFVPVATPTLSASLMLRKESCSGEVKEEVKPSKLTDDDKLLILSLIEDGKLTYKQIAEQFNIHPSRVGQIGKEFGMVRRKKKDTNELDIDQKKDQTEVLEEKEKLKEEVDQILTEALEEGPEEFENPPLLFKPFVIGKKKEFGLVEDRHIMPTMNHIFQSPISSSLMFNFEIQEEMVRDFIQENIKFNSEGVAEEDLVVYVTGLQSVLASVIKICFEKKVNLTLNHYNRDTKKYAPQIVWDCFGDRREKEISTDLDKLVYEFNSVQLYKFDNIIEDQVYWLIKKKAEQDSEVIITNKFENVWDLYPDMVQKIMNTSKPQSIFVDQVTLIDGKAVAYKNILSSYNTPKNS